MTTSHTFGKDCSPDERSQEGPPTEYHDHLPEPDIPSYSLATTMRIKIGLAVAAWAILLGLFGIAYLAVHLHR